MIKTVLATDMSNHFSIVSAFQQKFSPLSSRPNLKQVVGQNVALLIQMVVKTADLGHCYSRVQQHLYWSKCLEDEFFKQGDTERASNMRISPLMDRTLPGDPGSHPNDAVNCLLLSEVSFSLELSRAGCP